MFDLLSWLELFSHCWECWEWKLKKNQAKEDMFYFFQMKYSPQANKAKFSRKINVDSLKALNYCSAHNTPRNEGIPVGLHRPGIKNMLVELLQVLFLFLPHVVFCEQVVGKLRFRLNLQNTAVWLGWEWPDELSDGPRAGPRGSCLDSSTSSCAAASFTFNSFWSLLKGVALPASL